MFKGLMTAIVTPFKDGKVDYNTFEKLIEKQIKGGVDGIVPCGTTGESPTLSHEEHKEVVRFTVEIAKKRVSVLAGAGANNTLEAIDFSKDAKQSRADGVLSVSPYYNKPSQEGLYRHFTSIADEADIPVVLYNIPGRTSVNIEAQTIARLSKHKHIVGVKEATGSLSSAMELVNSCEKDFLLISGDDMLTIPLYSVGGCGVISVLSNMLPSETAKIVSYCAKGDYEQARKLHYLYLDLINTLFIETNPVPIKEALSLMKLCTNEVRMPLCNLSDENKEKLKEVLRGLDII